MSLLIKIGLWIVAVLFSIDGGLKFLVATSRMQTDLGALATVQIAVIAWTGLGIIHTLERLLRVRQEPPPVPKH